MTSAVRTSRFSLGDRGQRHFVLAALILGLAAGGWSWTVKTLKWAVHKEAVPWPEGVRVSQEFALQTLATQMGPYHMVREDGRLDTDARGELRRDGRPDGEVLLEDDVKEVLGVGTSADRTRYGARQSNWYCVRIYEDMRPDAAFRFWQLEVYYYTGALDKVPHVPERCWIAGGATLLGGQNVTFEAPGLTNGWSSPAVRRTQFEVTDRLGMKTSRSTQYYVFDFNGRPEESWKMVRLRLNDPRLRRCYFAKIQFGPLSEVQDVVQADQAAGEFFRAALPHVMKVLPSPEQLNALEPRGR
jgi:hypothetical protein